MSDIWIRARNHARDLRRRLRGEHAAPVLAAALNDAALSLSRLPPGDGLLAGSHAVLDRDSDAVWVRSDLPDSLAAFYVAHELAHFHLHPEYAASEEYEGATDTDTEGGAFLIGYGPRERRETEANVWARELLLPANTARDLFFEGGNSAAQIAERFGIAPAVVLRQLRAVLLPETLDTPAAPEPLPLDDSQAVAATTTHCPFLLGAGPGTGKTRTLAGRVKHLLESGVAPETILLLTFSRKATGELRERLGKHLPETVARRVAVCTFHAFGFDLLRRYHRHAGLPPNPVLLGDAEAFGLMETRLAGVLGDALWYPHDPTFPLRDCLQLIGRLKEEMVTPAEAMARATASGDAKREALCALYERYEAALREENALDSADLMCRAVTLLTENAAVREREQARWAHLLVDEYQDVNRAGAKLVQLLGGGGAGVWCVGDLRQAIYRFRGASPANVSRFADDFPGGTQGELAVNYRSRPPLVSCFGQLTEGGALWEANRADPLPDVCVTLAVADTGGAQSAGIVAEITRLRRENETYRWRDFAVLCRTNPQASALRAALVAGGVPVADAPAPLAWLRDPTVRELLLLLSLTCGREGALAASTGRVLPQTLRGKIHPADFLIEALYGEPGYARTATRPDFAHLLALAQGFAENNAAFLAHIRRIVRLGQAPRTAHDAEPGDAGDAVQVSTVHAAKGLEFPVVFVPNLSQGMFPPKPPPALFSDADTDALLGTVAESADEETRLFFVAATRARDYLFLSRAEKYDDRAAQPSALLLVVEKIPEVSHVRWMDTPPVAASTDTEPTETAPPAINPEDPATPAHELDRYLRCPRRYFYDESGYNVSRPRTPYDALKAATRARLREGDPAESFTDFWQKSGLDPADPWHDVYRAEAERIIAGEGEKGTLTPAPPFRHVLAEGAVEVKADGIAPDGTVERITFSKKKETGQSDAPNTLLFSAVPEGVAVRIRHVRTGEKRLVEPTTNASTRRARETHLARYNHALRGIRLRVFPATPGDKSDCADCMYLLICD